MKFDGQADAYDKRTGFGIKTAKNIASSIEQMIQPFLNAQFLEIGAGTGEIGFFLHNLPIPYFGIDSSAKMLSVYRKRLEKINKIPHLIQLDANTPWPLEDSSVSVFFSSRAMHQLNEEHVLEQLKKLSSSASALLILGNVKRDKKSTKSIMRKEMHKVLNEYGIEEKSGQSNRKLLFDAIEQQGGKKLPPIVAASWTANHTPIESLISWQQVDGIAGQEINDDLKTRVLESLTVNAEKIFPDLHTAVQSKETYELNAITLPF